MKKLLSILFAGLFSFTLCAQSNALIAHSKTPLANVPVALMPALNNASLLAAEMERRGPGTAPNFAEPIQVSISPATHGHWEQLANGNALWRLRIRSVGARSLNLGFTKYLMPAGGSLLLYAPDQQTVMGPFTPADNEEHAQLWTPILPGDELVVEVQVPAHSQSALQMELNYVNHDFVGFAEMTSGSCNLDVVCGAADGWAIVDKYRDIIQSVAVISTGGSTFCTGFLVNNGRQDCTPYFMTAHHCDITAGEAPSLVAYWNFQNSTCRQPNSPASGGNGNGVLNDFNTGSVLRATFAPSDFTLVELDDPVSESADAYFAGWSAEDFAPTDTVIAIHHPNTDEKRISFEFQPTFIANYNGTTPNPNGTHLTVPDWDIGTTEGGSSGSPLFNREKQVVGQLHGGSAFCGNNLQDSYGWFHTSWEGGGSPSTRLKDWLDPDNLGLITLDGRSALQCSFFVEGSPATQSLCAPADAVYTISVSPNFLDSVTLSVSNLPAGLVATFSTNPVAPGGTSTLTVSNTAAIGDGNFTITISGTDGTAFNSSELLLQIASLPPAPPNLLLPMDSTGGIGLTPIYTWTTVPDALYTIEVATDTSFTNVVETATNLNAGVYAGMVPLVPLTTYFWRVRGQNSCGLGDWPVSPNTFETGAIACAPTASTNVPLVITKEGGTFVTSTLVVSGGFLDDINVTNLGINHTWVGDLRVELTSPLGTTVVLFENPGGGDCDRDNILISLDDEAAATNSDLLNMCNATTPAIFGTFQPLTPLGAFNGQPAAGTWTLRVYDDADADGGSLVSWGLDLCTTIPNDFSVTPTSAAFTSCLGEGISFLLQLGTAFDDATGVTLTATDLPTGAVATFSPNPAPPGAQVNVTVTGAFEAGLFSFNVVGTDSLGNTGTTPIQWMVLGAPAAPTAISPVPGAINVSVNPVFSWSATGSSYTLTIATDSGMTNVVYTSSPQQPAQSVNGILDHCTTYFWRVTATTDCGTSAPGSVYSFTTLDDLLFNASPSTVTSCGTGTATTNLSLGDCFEAGGVTLAASGLPVGSVLAFGQNPAPAGGIVPINISLTDVMPGNYTVTLSGGDGIHTVTETFVLNVVAPAVAPALVAPANAATGANVLTFFDWNPVAGASSYHFELALDAAFTNLVTDVTIAQTAYTLGSPLEVNTTYYWRVTALNNCGGTTPVPFSFTTWLVNGVSEFQGGMVHVLPNPTAGDLNVQFSKPTSELVETGVYSVNGILVKSQQAQIGTQSLHFDLSELPSGVYVLRLKSGSVVLTEKIILEK